MHPRATFYILFVLTVLLTKDRQHLCLLSCDHTLCVRWPSLAGLSWFWHYHAWLTIQLHYSYHFSFYQCKKQAWFFLLCNKYAWQIFPIFPFLSYLSLSANGFSLGMPFRSRFMVPAMLMFFSKAHVAKETDVK